MTDNLWEAAAQIASVNAPYLRASLDLYPDCVAEIKARGPQIYFDKITSELGANTLSLEEEMARLRHYKRRAHLVIALADIAQIWDWVEVTETLTKIADVAMSRLLRAIASAHGVMGKADNPVPGLFILAVGKYGARELNYSSDIDFCVFYDPDKIQLPNMARAERTLIKVVQNLMAGFDRITPDGYIFRADLRLRPDPRSNSVAVSTHTAERYYETLGQNWERAAMIKARIAGGDRAVGAAFVHDVLRPFIWRRSLDYAAIDDIQAMKRQVQSAKSSDDIHPAGHHLKLGYGGIREIEFYAQTQQLILGGRRPEVRAMRTVDALAALAEIDAINAGSAQTLTHHYAKLRKFEHAAQMMDDAQTHIAPIDDEARCALSRLAGHETLQDFDAELLNILRDVHRLYTGLFPDSEALSLPEGSLSFTGVEIGPATHATLTTLGFSNPEHIWSDMAAWLGGRIAATRTERARELLTRLAPKLIDICAKTANPDAAFTAFSQFFTAQRSGVSLLSLFLSEPARLEDIIYLMTSSALLSRRIGDNPTLIDAMIDPAFYVVEPDNIGSDYCELIDDPSDFEGAMNAMRRAVHDDQFRVTAAVLMGRLSLTQAQTALSNIAAHVVQVMLPVAAAAVKPAVPGDYAVLGLGKAGGRELNLTSDLDVMVIYAPMDDSDTRTFTKMTQRFVSALSAVTAEGRLYEIDMALRPSGRSGPVAVSVDAFTRYYAEKAWTWEFMALSRARVMASSTPKFKSVLNDHVLNALTQPRPDLNIESDIADMLRRLRTEKPARGDWDVKYSIGGLRDCEFLAQSYILRGQKSRGDFTLMQSTISQLEYAHGDPNLSAPDRDIILNAVTFYQPLIQALSMTVETLEKDVDEASLSAVANAMGMSIKAMRAALDHHAVCVEERVQRYIFNSV